MGKLRFARPGISHYFPLIEVVLICEAVLQSASGRPRPGLWVRIQGAAAEANFQADSVRLQWWRRFSAQTGAESQYKCHILTLRMGSGPGWTHGGLDSLEKANRLKRWWAANPTQNSDLSP